MLYDLLISAEQDDDDHLLNGPIRDSCGIPTIILSPGDSLQLFHQIRGAKIHSIKTHGEPAMDTLLLIYTLKQDSLFSHTLRLPVDQSLARCNPYFLNLRYGYLSDWNSVFYQDKTYMIRVLDSTLTNCDSLCRLRHIGL
jgi:hypothetical protein